MEKIKNFKGVDYLEFWCNMNPKNPKYKKHWEWDVYYEQEDTENSELFYNAFIKGGKKIQQEIFEFLEMYYHLMILPKLVKENKVTMYHGERELLCLQITDGKPWLHHQNTIKSSFDECGDYENDDHHEIKGKHKFKYDPRARVWDFKKLLINIFNQHIK